MANNPNCPKLPWMVDFYTSEDGKVFNQQLHAAYANTTIEYMSCLNIKSRPSTFRETQFVGTVSPFTTVASMEDMMRLGVRTFRIIAPDNETILEILLKVRAVTINHSKSIGRIYPLAIALEVRGPEIRTGTVHVSTELILIFSSLFKYHIAHIQRCNP